MKKESLDKFVISFYDDEMIVKELRARGYEVTAKKGNVIL